MERILANLGDGKEEHVSREEGAGRRRLMTGKKEETQNTRLRDITKIHEKLPWFSGMGRNSLSNQDNTWGL